MVGGSCCLSAGGARAQPGPISWSISAWLLMPVLNVLPLSSKSTFLCPFLGILQLDPANNSSLPASDMSGFSQRALG